MLAQLFGEAAVVMKEKLNYKHPGGGGYAPHQDFAAYDFGSTHITCAIAIDAATSGQRLPLVRTGAAP